jgi:hypothetical protein
MYVFYLYVHVKKNNKIQFFQLNSAVFWFNVYALFDFQGNNVKFKRNIFYISNTFKI